MTFIVPTKDKGLFCFDCGEFVKNTANEAMKKNGYFAYSHSCPNNKVVRNKIKEILQEEKQ